MTYIIRKYTENNLPLHMYDKKAMPYGITHFNEYEHARVVLDLLARASPTVKFDVFAAGQRRSPVIYYDSGSLIWDFTVSVGQGNLSK